jgi:pilus assembly protein CpaB
MKPKTLILMVVAIGCGLAASYMTSRVIADRSDKDGEIEKVAVLVAKHNLTMGTLIKEPETLFEEKQYNKGEEPKKACRTFDQLKDKMLNKPVNAEQFVTPDDLTDKSQGGLPALMTKGKRAIGLKVNIDSAVAGFVLPHSRVDIIAIVKKSDKESYAKTILQNVLVLAADQSAVRPDDKQAVVSNTITVEVTPAEAERLSLASDLGPLRLVLRAFGDEEKVTTAGITPRNLAQGDNGLGDEKAPLFGTDGPASRAPLSAPKVAAIPAEPKPQPVAEAKAPEPPPIKTHTMTIYNGDQVTRAIFALDDKDGDFKIEKSVPDVTPPVKKAAKPAPAKK